MANSNPNGANQYTLDPRQNLCWKLYIDPNSKTFGNGLQSALKAGYDEAYANQITTTEWFKEKLRRLNMLNKAEKVLDETLETPHATADGKVDSAVLRVKTDVAKHITNTLGKDVGYSTRSEVTGKDGKDLVFNVVKYDENNNDSAQVQAEKVPTESTESTG